MVYNFNITAVTYHWVSKSLADMQIKKIFMGLPSPEYKD
jgi:hypothetical protein